MYRMSPARTDDIPFFKVAIHAEAFSKILFQTSLPASRFVGQEKGVFVAAMERPLICSSLHKRPDWAALLTALLQNRSDVRWKAELLETHDVAIPLPMAGLNVVFRAVLLTPSDVGTNETRTRIERLYNLCGGQYVGLVLLMKPNGRESSTAAMMRLQLELVGGLEVPIIPAASVEAAPTTLMAFHHQLSNSGGSQKRPVASPNLLPFCSHTRPLPEHTVNVLSDITRGMQDVAETASTSEGQQTLVQYLDGDAERVINFWKEEYVVE